MNKIIIGRNEEQQMLAEMIADNGADMLAITGRRRVGKTYLVRTYFNKKIHFEFSGVLNASLQDQLQSFAMALAGKGKNKKKMVVPGNWLEAFELLTQHLDKQKSAEKLLVFIDELPWLDTHKSKFLAALDWFWNSWAVNKNILVIICGSAASWMTSKIINNRGGLHNRVTKRMHLQPFTLYETEAYLKHLGVQLSRYQVLQLYMSLGGIPHYLKEIRKGQSAAQNIHRICFSKNGLLVNEFDNLYNALFTNAQQHINIIKALAAKPYGISRADIINSTKMTDGGTFTKVLNELEQSDFITACYPFDKIKKETIYRLTDEYSLFFLKFMNNKKNINWQQLSASTTYKTWSGYAFENICMKHIEQLKYALGISAVYTEISSFLAKGNAKIKGAQIDLLIDRQDNAINICEVKFYDKPFTLNKSYADELRNKLMVFQEKTGTRKSLFITLISPFPLVENLHSTGLVQQNVTAESLFRQ